LIWIIDWVSAVCAAAAALASLSVRSCTAAFSCSWKVVTCSCATWRERS
jgi:hypothetical protein